MTKIITYGTFDVLHRGHINLLKRAKALGDELYVGLSSDEFNAGKNKNSVLPYDDRKCVLESLFFVDFVFKEEQWDQKIPDVIKYGIDVFVIGDDWEGHFDFLKPHCKVMYLPRTPGVSTTLLKEKVVNMHG